MKNLDTMNEQRTVRHINEVGDDIKRLWTWYGLEMMVAVARKDWTWYKRLNRKTRLFSDCVVVGDEALALQIISMRGDKYIKDRNEAETAEEGRTKKKRGRKTAIDGDESTKVLTKGMDLFLKLRNDVLKIRSATRNDELGWEKYLREIELNELPGSTSSNGSEKGSGNFDRGFNSDDCPNDEIVGV
jgi:hypothetical protein